MRKLETIQKEDRLNEVYAIDEKGPGGANHSYMIKGKDCDYISILQFQKGPRKEESSRCGMIDPDILEVVRDRMKSFQDGDFPSEYNEKALYHIEQALYYLNKRVEDRKQRNVLGKNEK